MDKIKRFIVPAIVIIILIIPIITKYVENKNLSFKTYDEYNSMKASSSFAVVYFADKNSEDYAKTAESLKTQKSKFDIDAYAVDINSLTGEEIDELVESNELLEDGECFAIIKDKKVVYVAKTSVNLEEQIDKYLNNVIPKSEISYKTIETYKEFNEIINSKTTVMHVFGRNSCYYCNIFKPVYNELALEYKFDVYYYDSDSFDSTEYKKILNSGLNIPAECNSGTEAPLSSSFGTPLTLFTKKGKVVGCISGYVDSDTLLSKLKSLDIVK